MTQRAGLFFLIKQKQIKKFDVNLAHFAMEEAKVFKDTRTLVIPYLCLPKNKNSGILIIHDTHTQNKRTNKQKTTTTKIKLVRLLQ